MIKKCYELKCMHPLGPGLHLILPEKQQVAQWLLEYFGVEEEFQEDLRALGALANTKAAVSCKVYPSPGNEVNDDQIFAIARLYAWPDGTFGVHLMGLRVEPDYPMAAEQVADMLRTALTQVIVL